MHELINNTLIHNLVYLKSDNEYFPQKLILHYLCTSEGVCHYKEYLSFSVRKKIKKVEKSYLELENNIYETTLFSGTFKIEGNKVPSEN